MVKCIIALILKRSRTDKSRRIFRAFKYGRRHWVTKNINVIKLKHVVSISKIFRKIWKFFV